MRFVLAQQYLHFPPRKLFPLFRSQAHSPAQMPESGHCAGFASSRWTATRASSVEQDQAAIAPLPINTSTSQPQPITANRLALVDAHALLYRYNFAFGPKLLTSSSGEDTSIAYGFLATLLSLLELRPPPTHVAVVFDAPGKTFRHEMFPGYKAQRPPMPDGIKQVVPRIKEILTIMGIPMLSVAGIEADDVIGSTATRAIEDGFAVAVASPDKDFFQLLQPNLQLLRPPKKGDSGRALTGGLVPYNQQAFEVEFGLKPSQWADALALSGDAADNIPGVPGIGMKGAIALLQQFGSLSRIVDNAPQISKKRQREALSSEEGVAAARLSLDLVQIKTRLEIPPVRMPLSELELLPLGEEQKQAVKELLSSMDFKQHAKRLEAIWADYARGT